MADLVAYSSVIWEECIDEKLSANVPFIGKKCVEIKTYVRLISDSRRIFIEVEAFSRRWRYVLKSAAYTVFDSGIARLHLCVQTISGGVRIVLEGCIGVESIKKHQLLIAKDIRFFAMNDISAEELTALGFDDPAIAEFRNTFSDAVGTIAGSLTEMEIAEVIAGSTEIGSQFGASHPNGIAPS